MQSIMLEKLNKLSGESSTALPNYQQSS